MPRLLFEKTGNSIWISHLDLMRVFQRAFKRAGLPLTHTHGFNPRPSVSIALPLSVGTESLCELLDFDLDGEIAVSNEEIKEKLNDALVQGVRVLSVYDGGRKIRDLSLLHCQITLQYDRGVPVNAEETLTTLFSQETLLVEKKTKSGMQQQDIIPMIRKLNVAVQNDRSVLIDAVICCQNPTLNPAQIVSAIHIYAQEFAPDFATFKRIEIMDQNENVFR